MARAILTNPIPTLEEFGDSLGLSKARQRALIDLMRRSTNGRVEDGAIRKSSKSRTPRRKTARAKVS